MSQNQVASTLPLTIASEQSNGTLALLLAGELDLAACADAEAELRQFERSDHRRLVLDLRGLTFIDSMGLMLLIRASNRARESRREFVVRRGGGAQVERVIDVCGLGDVLRLESAEPL